MSRARIRVNRSLTRHVPHLECASRGSSAESGRAHQPTGHRRLRRTCQACHRSLNSRPSAAKKPAGADVHTAAAKGVAGASALPALFGSGGVFA